MKLLLLLLVPVWAQTCDMGAVELAIKEPDEALELLQVKKIKAGKGCPLVIAYVPYVQPAQRLSSNSAVRTQKNRIPRVSITFAHDRHSAQGRAKR